MATWIDANIIFQEARAMLKLGFEVWWSWLAWQLTLLAYVLDSDVMLQIGQF
jgi:hypothetical protein